MKPFQAILWVGLISLALSISKPGMAFSTQLLLPTASLSLQQPGGVDWCGGHGVPESACTICNPELIPKFKAAGDWCTEHSLPESVCPTCNPVQAPTGQPVDWCVGHAVPESSCTLCNPELIPEFKEAGDWCAEHGLPESVCAICNPGIALGQNDPRALEALTVRLKNLEMEEVVGIETAKVTAAQSETSIKTPAQIAFHADRVADVRAILPGIVRNIYVEPGTQVEAGDPLFQLESTRVGELQGQFQSARQEVVTAEAQLKRLETLVSQGMATSRELDLVKERLAHARSEQATAQNSLDMAGASTDGRAGRYELQAQLAGTIIRRPAILGTQAALDTSLAAIADTSVMWVLCQVPEALAGQLKTGLHVHITVPGNEEIIHGDLDWIAAEIDPRTRTVTARAISANPEGVLRANQFVRAEIFTGDAEGSVSVPRQSIQRVGELEVVFVRIDTGRYQPRVVKRSGDGELVRVQGRLNQGDEVVTTGAVLLRTEVMPGAIGAGCCEFETPGAAEDH